MTTKIYIKEIEPISLKKHFSKLDEYFRQKEIFVELISSEGMFVIENNQLYKLKPVDKEVLNQSFEGYTLLFDTSYFEKEHVLSQIPYEHVRFNTVKFHYGEEIFGKKYFLRLVVEGFYEKENSYISSNNNNNNNDNNNNDKYNNFVPTNFYFLANESFDNILVKKEFNVFLSMLK
jgi:hypothetical protein